MSQATTRSCPGLRPFLATTIVQLVVTQLQAWPGALKGEVGTL